LLGSVFNLAQQHAILRAAGINGALLFGAFSIFWVGLTPWLTSDTFHLDGRAAGLFALVGIIGATIAPFTGRMTDRYGSNRIIALSAAIMISAFVLFVLAGGSLIGLVAGTILLDIGLQSMQIGNQARIYAVAPEARSRINAFYMTCFFLG